MDERIFVHQDPVWRERSNFILFAHVPNEDNPDRMQWEQLWARRVADDRFVICCIPFFVYDLHLGDEVEAGPEAGHSWVVRRVLQRSGHYTFRVWFGDTRARAVRDETFQQLKKMGCSLEWSSKDLLAVDVDSEEQIWPVADYLLMRQEQGELIYEIGWTPT